MITGTAGQGALPLASRVLTPGARGETARCTETGIAGRMQRGFVHGILGVLTVGAPLFAQPPGPEGLREEVDAQYRVTETSGGIGLLPRGDDRGIALIELRGEAVYIDGAGPLSVQRLTDELGADAAPLLRLRLLDIPAQRSVLGLPARTAQADAAGAPAEAAADAVAEAAAVADAADAEAEDEVAPADAAATVAAPPWLTPPWLTPPWLTPPWLTPPWLTPPWLTPPWLTPPWLTPPWLTPPWLTPPWLTPPWLTPPWLTPPWLR